MLQKPTNIYETTTTTTTKKPNKSFEYEKPEGWDKKTPAFRFSFFGRLKRGIFDEEMDASDQRKLDAFLFDLKVGFISLTIVMVLFIAVFNGPWMSGKYTGEEFSPTYLDYVMDFFIDKYDEFMNGSKPPTVKTAVVTTVPVQQDTLPTIVEDVSPSYLDSFIAKYKQDSARITDSLNALE